MASRVDSVRLVTSSKVSPLVGMGGRTAVSFVAESQLTPDAQGTGLEAGTAVEHAVVVLGDDAHHGHLGLDREVERALLEGEQRRLGVERTRALGEHPEGDAPALHVLASLGDRLVRALAVLAVDEHGARRVH
jgi:hypothetical protein